MIEIKVPFQKLEKIIHLADVHIRLFKRHDEFREVFDTLFTQLKETDLTKAVIVVAGDIVHSKTELSPEMVDLASYFLKNLSNLAPTLVIAGNHDLSINNPNRLDALSPICENIKNDNLHYLKYSDIYSVADVQFGVMSLIGEQSEWATANQLTSKTKIALFHGPLYNAQTDVGYTITSRHVTTETFDGFDMVLLGDIHKHQVLQEYDESQEKPVIVYSSSLIQQNHGETVKGHGWCEWDVEKRTFEFHELENQYGYYTLTVNDNGTIPDYSDMPNKARLRIMAGPLDQADIKKLETEIRSKYNIVEITKTNYKGIKSAHSTVTGNAFLDINDVTYQNKIIVDYLKNVMPNLSEDTLDSVLKLNKTLNESVSRDDLAKKIVWRPIHLKYDNLFTYGEDNFIQFDTLNGMNGIFAPNASGKTSIADALCFALYDRTPRTNKAASIMNYRKDSCYCELVFEINGTKFTIERTGKRNKKGEVKIDVDFYKVDDKGEKVSLNGEERRYTNSNIRDYVGDYEDFVLTTLSSSSQTGLFVDRGQSDRKDLLSQFMGLNIFDKLHTTANEESKEVAAALKRFKQDDFSQELVDTDVEVDQLNGEIQTVEQSIQQNDSVVELLVKDIQAQYEKKIPVTITSDLPTLESQKKQAELAKEGYIANIELTKQKITERQESLDGVLEQIMTPLVERKSLLARAHEKIKMFDGVLEQYTDFQTLTTAITKGTTRLETNKKLKVSKVESLNHLLEHKYNPECDMCLMNGNTIITQKEKVQTEIDSLDVEYDGLIKEHAQYNEELIQFGDIEERYKKYQTATAFIQKTEKEISDLEIKLERTKAQHDRDIHELQQKVQTLEVMLAKADEPIKEAEYKIAEYTRQVDAIEQNKVIDQEIAKLTGQKSIFTNETMALQGKVRQLTSRIAVLTQKKADMLNRIKEAEELESKYDVYEAYLTAVCRDGLPYTLVSEILPQVEESVNALLSQMVDFQLIFDMDGKNVNMRLSYDEKRTWPLELASGMEKFISGLAIRVALMSVSSLPKSNFLIIDEGLGALDGDNLASMYGLFEVLKTKFDFILVISHVDSVRDISDRILEIKRQDGFSQIQEK